MAHDFEEKIKCPYCDFEMEDYDHNYHNADGDEIDCDKCNKHFYVTTNTEITYSTSKKDCEWNKHEYYEEILSIDQKTCDRWNKENLCNRTDHKPHKLISRKCNNCDIENIRSEYYE